MDITPKIAGLNRGMKWDTWQVTKWWGEHPRDPFDNAPHSERLVGTLAPPTHGLHIVCWQLSGGLRFNIGVSATEKPATAAYWLRVLTIGRRPRATLVRIIVLVAACFVVFKFLLLPIRIDGISMQPTFHTGQVNFINRAAYFFHEPQRGDIISVRLSEARGWSKAPMYMKRIIGLPGETVVFHNGRVYINGELLDEPYLKLPCDWEHAPIVCSPTQYYVVGDNRSMPFELHEQGRAERRRIMGRSLL